MAMATCPGFSRNSSSKLRASCAPTARGRAGRLQHVGVPRACSTPSTTRTRTAARARRDAYVNDDRSGPRPRRRGRATTGHTRSRLLRASTVRAHCGIALTVTTFAEQLPATSHQPQPSLLLQARFRLQSAFAQDRTGHGRHQPEGWTLHVATQVSSLRIERGCNDHAHDRHHRRGCGPALVRGPQRYPGLPVERAGFTAQGVTTTRCSTPRGSTRAAWRVRHKSREPPAPPTANNALHKPLPPHPQDIPIHNCDAARLRVGTVRSVRGRKVAEPYAARTESASDGSHETCVGAYRTRTQWR